MHEGKFLHEKSLLHESKKNLSKYKQEKTRI